MRHMTCHRSLAWCRIHAVLNVQAVHPSLAPSPLSPRLLLDLKRLPIPKIPPGLARRKCVPATKPSASFSPSDESRDIVASFSRLPRPRSSKFSRAMSSLSMRHCRYAFDKRLHRTCSELDSCRHLRKASTSDLHSEWWSSGNEPRSGALPCFVFPPYSCIAVRPHSATSLSHAKHTLLAEAHAPLNSLRACAQHTLKPIIPTTPLLLTTWCMHAMLCC